MENFQKNDLKNEIKQLEVLSININQKKIEQISLIFEKIEKKGFFLYLEILENSIDSLKLIILIRIKNLILKKWILIKKKFLLILINYFFENFFFINKKNIYFLYVDIISMIFVTFFEFYDLREILNQKFLELLKNKKFYDETSFNNFLDNSENTNLLNNPGNGNNLDIDTFLENSKFKIENSENDNFFSENNFEIQNQNLLKNKKAEKFSKKKFIIDIFLEILDFLEEKNKNCQKINKFQKITEIFISLQNKKILKINNNLISKIINKKVNQKNLEMLSKNLFLLKQLIFFDEKIQSKKNKIFEKNFLSDFSFISKSSILIKILDDHNYKKKNCELLCQIFNTKFIYTLFNNLKNEKYYGCIFFEDFLENCLNFFLLTISLNKNYFKNFENRILLVFEILTGIFFLFEKTIFLDFLLKNEIDQNKKKLFFYFPTIFFKSFLFNSNEKFLKFFKNDSKIFIEKIVNSYILILEQKIDIDKKKNVFFGFFKIFGFFI